MIRRVLLLVVLVICSLLFPMAWKKATDGFHPARFKLKLPFRPGWETPCAPIDLSAALGGTWTYLGRGAQSFVFSNGEYVLKIFQKNRHIFFRDKQSSRRNCDLTGGALAFRNLPKETALVYLHLNLTEGKLPSVQIKDRIGRRYRIPLDRCHFVIQKRARPLKEAFQKAVRQGQVEAYLESFFALLQNRIDKGIWNGDRSLEANFGFIGDQATEIDFGRYRMMVLEDKKSLQKEEWNHFTGALRGFLQQNFPQEVKAFDARWRPWGVSRSS